MTTEIEIINKELEAPALDPVFLQVANEYLTGKNIQQIAEGIGVSDDRVAQVLEKKEVQSYINHVFLTQGYMNRMRLSGLISSVIQKKLIEAEETGVISKKDLFDWIKLMVEWNKDSLKKDKGPQVAVQVNNNYDSLMKDLMTER